MAIKKKSEQIASFDPFLRDAAGTPIGTRDPSPFFTPSAGGGTTTIKDTSEPAVNPRNPNATGILTDVKTGRPSGLATSQGTFFATGSDLELLKQQQESKGNLSGSEKISAPGEGTLKANQAEFNKQAAFQPGQAQQISNIGIPSLASAAAGFIQGVQTGNALLLLNSAARGDVDAAATLGLNELDMRLLISGQAKVNSFAQWAESVPIIGKKKFGVAGFKWSVSDLTGTTPSETVQQLLDEIKAQAGLAQQAVTLSALNPALADYYVGQVKDIEQNILILESRIKLLSIQSPAIQGDPDNVIAISSEIQKSLNTIDEQKLKLGIQ